ncbi:MAG: endospore germination permease [Oscillospiraceae bacterium]|nr:endospore germination permease [Oscillospiraceae bacterium]
MLQRKKITSLIINAIAVKMLLTYPRNIILNSGNAAWIQILYNFIIAILIFALTAVLYRGKKNIIELADSCGGKSLKIIVGIIVFAILSANLISVARIYPETIKTILLQESSVELIIILFAVIIAIGAYMGIESIATVHYLFLPIAGIVMVSFLLLLIPYYKFDNLFPILGNGAKSIFIDGFNSISVFSDIILLNIFLPYMENYSEFKKSGFRVIIIGGVIAFLITLAYCSVYPYPSSKNFIFPVYQLTRIIHLSSFFSRFETFFEFVWSILIMLYAAFYMYAICYVLQITFNLKFHKPLIVPLTIIIFGAAILPSSFMKFIELEMVIYYIVYPFAFLLPIIFAAASRKLNGGKHEKT